MTSKSLRLISLRGNPMRYELQSLTVNGADSPNPATILMDKPKKVVSNYIPVTLMSVVVKNPGTTDRKITVATSPTEYTIPAGGSTTIQIKAGDVITLV